MAKTAASSELEVECAVQILRTAGCLSLVFPTTDIPEGVGRMCSTASADVAERDNPKEGKEDVRSTRQELCGRYSGAVKEVSTITRLET